MLEIALLNKMQKRRLEYKVRGLCWGRSSRRCDLWFDLQAGPGQSGAPHPISCLWNTGSFTFPTPRGCSEDTALR